MTVILVNLKISTVFVKNATAILMVASPLLATRALDVVNAIQVSLGTDVTSAIVPERL